MEISLPRNISIMEEQWMTPTPGVRNSSFDINNESLHSLTSNISISQFPYYQHSLTLAAVYTLAYLFIFLLCMIGNGLVCVIVLRNPNMRTVTNLFIFNLAISDLLVGIFCIPTTLVDNLITGWPFSNTVCKASGLIQGMSVCASVFTLVAIAVDRFRCIVYPFKPKLSLVVAKGTIGLIWLLALIIMFPTALMLKVEEEPGHVVLDDKYNFTFPLYNCYERWPNPAMRKVYTTVLFAHIYLVPLSVIVLLYGRIGVKLHHRQAYAQANAQELCNTNQPGKSPKMQRHERVVKMLVVVTLLFMLSWLPLWTLLLLTDYALPEGDKLDLLTGYVFPFSHWLAFSNSSVNPIIYGYFNENFKKGFQAACKAQSCCPSGSQGLVKKRRKERRSRRKRSRHGCILGAGEALPVGNLPVRNRVHSDVTNCVQLEMESRGQGLAQESCSHGLEGMEGHGTAGKDASLKATEMVTSHKRAVSHQAWEP